MPRREDYKRPWVATCSWPGRRPFTVGTFWTRADGSDQEARDEALALYAESMGATLPEAMQMPEVLTLHPAALVYCPDER